MAVEIIQKYAQGVATRCGGSNIQGLVKTANGPEKVVKFDPITIASLITAIIPLFGMCKKRQETPPAQVQEMVRKQHQSNPKAQKKEWANDILRQAKAKLREEEKAHKAGGLPVDYGRYSITKASAEDLAGHTIDHFLSLSPQDAETLVRSQMKAK